MTGTLRSTPSLARNPGLAWFLLGFSLLLALPAAAQTDDPTLDAPVRFLIESITVEGVDRPATREIVAKESRIEPGSEVDEDQLRQANYRVRRLPFVIDADFALQKGSERGRYVLVIRIEMASSIVANLDGFWSEAHGDGFLSEFDWNAAVGARTFIGSRGYAFGSIDRDGNFNVGYTQFHLFGPGSYLSAAGSTNLDDRDKAYQLSLSAGKPLTATQFLRASIDYGTSDLFEGQSVNLEWRFDSTDDPLLPTQGGTVSIGAGYGTASNRFQVRDGFRIRSDDHLLSLGAVAQRYWALTSRHSVWGLLGASRSKTEVTEGPDRTRFNFTSDSASAGLGYSLDLLRSQVGEPRNDLRFSASGLLTKGKGALETLNLLAGLTYRRPQGSISLTFSYIDELGRRRLDP
ncbi:MAG TPA: hypothetical protein VGS22_20175 [Thermoanaerobaculia bacterium]|nr:hypothetical protein [Thermoanaerobaculia bacterium]